MPSESKLSRNTLPENQKICEEREQVSPVLTSTTKSGSIMMIEIVVIDKISKASLSSSQF